MMQWLCRRRIDATECPIVYDLCIKASLVGGDIKNVAQYDSLFGFPVEEDLAAIVPQRVEVGVNGQDLG